jgi:alanine racemase
MNKSPLSYIELSKKNLIYNIEQFKKLAKNGTKFSVAIKGNAYGHGQNEIAKILEPYVDYFQLNSVEELELLKKVSKKKVLILGYIQKENLLKAIKLGCIISPFSIEELKNINKIAKKLKIKQEIHLPIDALLGREGFLISGLPKFFKELKKCKNVKLSGIYAHFANIEDTNNFTHAEKQIKEYEKAKKIAEKFGYGKFETHISATSGLLVYERKGGINSLIRLGIGIYGLWPSEHIKYLYKNKMELKPVLSWKTKVAQVKNLPAGYTVGYGLTYMTHKPMKIAVIPQGYADGLDRGLSNKGEVIILGTRCKILGRIAMNMFVVDVSHLPKVKVEDEVMIIGTQKKPARLNSRSGGQQITAEEMAEKIDTINYEITTRINSLLPRVII